MQDSMAKDTALRALWMATLARSTGQQVEGLVPDNLAGTAFEWLRRPHTGLVMVRGRTGGSGNPFNLGEITVTRCALRLENGTVGHGYVQGRSKRHAELAALLDALLQDEGKRDRLLQTVIEPLKSMEIERRRAASRKAASTRVEFFTMVRGENPA